MQSVCQKKISEEYNWFGQIHRGKKCEGGWRSSWKILGLKISKSILPRFNKEGKKKLREKDSNS